MAPRKKKAAALLAVPFIDHGLRLIQTADTLAKEDQSRLREMTAALIALILAADLKDAAALIASVQELITSTYAEISAQSTAALATLAPIESRFVTQAINDALNAKKAKPVADHLEPLLEDRPVAAWWDAQRDNTLFKVTAAINAAARIKAPVEDLAKLMESPTGPLAAVSRNAQSLTDVAIHRAANEARLTTLQANSALVDGVQVSETLDSRTCPQCLAYDGSTYDLDGNPTEGTTLPFNGGPPFHPACRGNLIPILTGTTPSSPLTAEKWLDTKSSDEQDEILGVGRAKLYRDGKITLRDLVSKTGKQMTLDELKNRYT
jgi:hypothetical protein